MNALSPSTYRLDDIDAALPVGQRLYRALRARIVGGGLLPNTRLSEVEVASKYEVSRQPVREAFIKLAEESLVEIRPQRGTYVSRIHVSAVMSARFVREAVEADIARALCGRGEARFADELNAMIDAQRQAVEAHDAHAFLQLDEAFHRALAKEAGQAASWDILQPLKTQMDRVRHLSARQFPLRQLLAQHIEIVEAIGRGSRQGADEAMRAHLRQILNDLPAIIAALPAYFDDLVVDVTTAPEASR